MELSKRLARLGLRRGVASLARGRQDSAIPPPSRRTCPEVERRGSAIEELVAGEVVETELGACFRAEESFSLDYVHGSLSGLSPGTGSLASLLGQSPQAAAGLARNEQLSALDFQQAAFLDTETTGLAGGTGTYVFLVGVGYFSNAAFHVAQFFMRGLEEEQAMLRMLAGFLDRFRAVVSFNGQAFDLPLLRTRFTLAHMAPCLTDLPHFDLLFPARRLWRARLDSCALSALEADILGVYRGSSDVPSWQIPALYTDYLRTGDAQEMARVFYHNQQDVLSLVVLAGHMCQLFSDPWAALPCAADLYSLGRIYESLALIGEAERAYRAALGGSLPQELHDHTLRCLSFLLKRQERREEAAELWWKAVADGRQLYPYVELAKHYEWHAKDWARAAEVTRRALDQLEIAPPGPQRRRAQAELRYRLARLERKMG